MILFPRPPRTALIINRLKPLIWSTVVVGGMESSWRLTIPPSPFSIVRSKLQIFRESPLYVLSDLIDRCIPAKFFDFLAVFHISQSYLSRNLLVHGYNSRHLLLSEEKDLEHEMIPFIGAAGQSCLAHEDKAHQENSLHGDDGSEKRKRQGIKVRD